MKEDKGQSERLLDVFLPVTTEEWEAVIREDLKGADYDKKLVWRTLEGFTVQPYYREEDLEKLPKTDGNPGMYPYTRGNRSDGNGWLIRQDIDVDDFSAANRLALDYMSRGADSIAYVLDPHREVTKEDFKTLLRGVDLASKEVNFVNPGRGDLLLPALGEALVELGVDAKGVRGSVGFSQTEWLARKGRLCPNHGGPAKRTRDAVMFHKAYPGIQTLAVDGRIFHNSGATAVQELAYALAQAAQLLDWATSEGIEASETATAIRFNFSVGTLYFMEIAKFRAARYLWTKVLEGYGVQAHDRMKMIAHAETSRFNQTVYDPYINLLRAATEGMSSVLAGVHSLTVLPFDTPYEKPGEFSTRMARNAQLLLREESYFDKVVDPAGGSYYVSVLTDSLARAAWNLFLEVQRDGGYVEAMQRGAIQKAVADLAATRRKRYATRKDTLLGTNQFPNFTEHLEPNVIAAAKAMGGDTYAGGGAPSGGAVAVGLAGSESSGCSHGGARTAEPLHPFRGAEELESLRMDTDRAEHRPVAFMLAIGNLAMRRARAQFSCNFFACAGFEVIDNVGFETIDEGLAAARGKGADIIVLCSSDDEYLELGKEAFPKIGPREVFVVAGAPACQGELEALGVRHFISVKSNLLDTLKLFQRELGVVK